MFTVAMYRQLAGQVDQIGFVFDPKKINETYDFIAIPCANWLNSYSNWDWMSDLLDQVEIPLVPIGLGLQANSTDLSAVTINDSCMRLARIFQAKAKMISVRGDFTRDYLRSIGIDNVVTTGCPSLYMRMNHGNSPLADDDSICLQSTRYGITGEFVEKSSINREIFRVAKARNADIIFQSEPEEIRYLISGDISALALERAPNLLANLYGFETAQELATFLDEHGKVFTDLDAWSRHVRTKSVNIGTRLHGTILALNSDVPAALIPHDSRTSEMAAFANMPTVELGALQKANVAREINPMDLQQYYETRSRNGKTYREFLRSCNVDFNEVALL